MKDERRSRHFRDLRATGIRASGFRSCASYRLDVKTSVAAARRPLLLCQVGSCDKGLLASRGVFLERAVDDVREAALEHAEGLQAAVALCLAPREQRSRARVPVRLGERNPVQGGVQLAVADRLRRWRARFEDQTGSGAVPL